MIWNYINKTNPKPKNQKKQNQKTKKNQKNINKTLCSINIKTIDEI